MTNSTRKWIRGALEVLIYGTAAAITVGLVTYKTDMTWPEWWVTVRASFIANGGLRFVQYFATHPLPSDEDTAGVNKSGEPTLGTPIVSLNPLSQVQPVNQTVK